MTRSCGVPSRVGGMGRTSSETLIAKAKAELEEERKVGTGLTELQPKKKKSHSSGLVDKVLASAALAA